MGRGGRCGPTLLQTIPFSDLSPLNLIAIQRARATKSPSEFDVNVRDTLLCLIVLLGIS